MGKSTTHDPTAIGLVKAGLITYKQLNEVHRLLKSTGGGGNLEDLLVERGYLTRQQLAIRKQRLQSRKPAARLADSLDLVKQGLVSFRQLNECHREARASKGERNVVDLLVEKGYVTEEQLAAAGGSDEERTSRRFSSSWRVRSFSWMMRIVSILNS